MATTPKSVIAGLSDIAPGRHFVAVTPSDTTVLSGIRALYVGTGGDVIVDEPNGTNILFKNVANGQFLPISPTKVKAATTAADILAIS